MSERRKRIAFHVLGLEVGGTEWNVACLALGLDRRRFDPFVLWDDTWGPLGERLQQGGIPVIQAPLAPSKLPATVQTLRDLQPDVFHSFGTGRAGRDVEAAVEAGIPAILTFRADMRFRGPFPAQEWERRRNEATFAITAVAHSVAEVVRTVEQAPPDKIRVIHNGVRVPGPAVRQPSFRQELGLDAAAPLIGYVANYRPEKGHGNLLRAFAQVARQRPAVHLVCCGGGFAEVKAGLETLRRELGLETRATLLDYREPDALYRGIGIYVHPSDTEGFSNALLEAMSHGLPIAATGVGGNVEAIVPEESGLLVRSGDADGLAAALIRLLDDEALRDRLGSAARQRVMDHFTMDRMIAAYSDLYEEALAGRS